MDEPSLFLHVVYRVAQVLGTAVVVGLAAILSMALTPSAENIPAQVMGWLGWAGAGAYMHSVWMKK